MPAKDIYHDAVKLSLVKDGWTITNDPLLLQYGAKDLFVDLGAEKILAAEKSGDKIAVEIKSFISPSPMNDLEKAIGQYIREHANFVRTYELVSGGKINENRGRNQSLLNNETSQSEKAPETSPSRSRNSVSRSRD